MKIFVRCKFFRLFLTFLPLNRRLDSLEWTSARGNEMWRVVRPVGRSVGGKSSGIFEFCDVSRDVLVPWSDNEVFFNFFSQDSRDRKQKFSKIHSTMNFFEIKTCATRSHARGLSQEKRRRESKSWNRKRIVCSRRNKSKLSVMKPHMEPWTNEKRKKETKNLPEAIICSFWLPRATVAQQHIFNYYSQKSRLKLRNRSWLFFSRASPTLNIKCVQKVSTCYWDILSLVVRWFFRANYCSEVREERFTTKTNSKTQLIVARAHHTWSGWVCVQVENTQNEIQKLSEKERLGSFCGP